jgi:hypothetical protein
MVTFKLKDIVMLLACATKNSNLKMIIPPLTNTFKNDKYDYMIYYHSEIIII